MFRRGRAAQPAFLGRSGRQGTEALNRIAVDPEVQACRLARRRPAGVLALIRAPSR